MHPALVFSVTHGPSIAAWILGHRAELGVTFERFSKTVFEAITNPTTAGIDRIGSTLVSLQNGQTEVIGLLHRHATKLDRLVETVRSIHDGIGLLTRLSLVGLGASVFSQVHLAFQFARLTQRLKRLEAEVHEIKEMKQAEFRGSLNAGLTQLKMAFDREADNADLARVLYHQASNSLTNSTAKYIELLESGVGGGNPQAKSLLARHLTLSVLGEVAVDLQLREPELAIQALARVVSPLRLHTQSVFARTVGSKPTKFLMPALARHGVTLEVLTELYRQARLAEVLTDPQLSTTTELFESLRGRLVEATDPVFFVTSRVHQLREEFVEATVAVEELNRLRGLALAIEKYDRTNRGFQDLTDQIRQMIEARQPDEGTCFAVFPDE